MHGVLALPGEPLIVFLTVCTRARRRWLADPAVHARLVAVWRDATAWRVGRYVIMPDHIHLFAAPGEPSLPLENWVRYWKSQFSRGRGAADERFEPDHWDTRLRRRESYEAKWDYVVNNPVRHGLVTVAEKWPYQGELFKLEW